MLGAVIATSFAAGMYCLYYGYHPVLQPFPLGVTFLTGNVTGHSIVSKPSMQCVQYDSRCNSVCGVSGSDCEHARCDAFCVTRELGIGFTCAVNIYPDHILYAMSVQDMRTARTRKSALDLCASLFPLKSTFKGPFPGLKGPDIKGPLLKRTGRLAGSRVAQTGAAVGALRWSYSSGAETRSGER